MKVRRISNVNTLDDALVKNKNNKQKNICFKMNQIFQIHLTLFCFKETLHCFCRVLKDEGFYFKINVRMWKIFNFLIFPYKEQGRFR